MATPCMRNELNLFSMPPVQVSIEGGQWTEVVPLTSLNGGSTTTIEFVKGASADHFYDLSKTLFYVQCKITKADGGEVGGEDLVSTANNTLATMFNQVEVSLNGERVSSASLNYPYKAYLETHLGHGKEAKSSRLSAQFYQNDSNLGVNEPKPSKPAGSTDEPPFNPGLLYRHEKCGKNEAFEMIGRPNCDIFNVKRFLIPGVEIRLRFTRSKDSFCLMTPDKENEEFKINILDAKLMFHRVSVSPSLALAVERTLDVKPALYPMVRTETRVFHIASDRYGASIDNLFGGVLPKRITLGMVRNEAYNGDYHQNPFNFEHFNLNKLVLYCDGERIPWNELKLDYGKGDFLQGYYTLFAGGDGIDSDGGNGISRAGYLDGSVLFCFDLTPDQSAANAGHVCPERRGNLRIDLEFGKRLPTTVNLVALCEFDTVLAIDKVRNVIFDYTPPTPPTVRSRTG